MTGSRTANTPHTPEPLICNCVTNSAQKVKAFIHCSNAQEAQSDTTWPDMKDQPKQSQE